MLTIRVTGELVEWRGPAPFHFVRIEGSLADEIRDISREVTYGWGMVPVLVSFREQRWTTSLWPRHGGYMLPVRDAVRHATALELGDEVDLELEIVARDSGVFRC